MLDAKRREPTTREEMQTAWENYLQFILNLSRVVPPTTQDIEDAQYDWNLASAEGWGNQNTELSE